MLSPLVREEFFFAKTALLLLTLLSPRGDNWGFSAVPGCNFGQRMFLGVFILLAARSKLVSGFIFRTYSKETVPLRNLTNIVLRPIMYHYDLWSECLKSSFAKVVQLWCSLDPIERLNSTSIAWSGGLFMAPLFIPYLLLMALKLACCRINTFLSYLHFHKILYLKPFEKHLQNHVKSMESCHNVINIWLGRNCFPQERWLDTLHLISTKSVTAVKSQHDGCNLRNNL